MGKILGIANQKGGVGKSTTSINLAVFLARRGCMTLLIDIDPQGNSTSAFFNKGLLNHTLSEVLTSDIDIDEVIRVTRIDNLDLLPSNFGLHRARMELEERDDGNFILQNKLSQIKNDYDYIIIDCPPSKNVLTTNALIACDSVLIPVQCEKFSIDGISDMRSMIEEVQETYNSKLKIEGLLLTMFDKRTRLHVDSANSVTKYFGELAYPIKIPQNIALSETPVYEGSLTRFKRDQKGAKAYLELADMLIETK